MECCMPLFEKIVIHITGWQIKLHNALMQYSECLSRLCLQTAVAQVGTAPNINLITVFKLQLPEFNRDHKQRACVLRMGHYLVLLKLQMNNRLNVPWNELNIDTRKEYFFHLVTTSDTNGVPRSIARCLSRLFSSSLDLEAENSARSDSPVKGRLGVYLVG